MTVHRIRSKVLRAEGHKIEGAFRPYVEERLAEIKKRDPHAKIITVQVR